tara:strand:+ start:445 stop:1257 length:813 start_codon:yes stop_codon:yes gene_type:complete
MKERVISLMNDLEEEDFYRENFDDVPDDVLELKDIPTDVLEPSHYKILRQMIDFIDSYKSLKEENESLRHQLEEEIDDTIIIVKNLQEENEKLKKENHDLRNIPPKEFHTFLEKNFDFEKLALEVNDGLLEENKKLKEENDKWKTRGEEMMKINLDMVEIDKETQAENKKQKGKLDRYQKMFEKLEKSGKIIGVLYYCNACGEYRDNDSEGGFIQKDCDGNDISTQGNNCELCGEVWADAEAEDLDKKIKVLQTHAKVYSKHAFIPRTEL